MGFIPEENKILGMAHNEIEAIARFICRLLLAVTYHIVEAAHTDINLLIMVDIVVAVVVDTNSYSITIINNTGGDHRHNIITASNITLINNSSIIPVPVTIITINLDHREVVTLGPIMITSITTLDKINNTTITQEVQCHHKV